MSDLRTAIGEFTDQQLRNACFREKDEYTAEAMAFIRDELSKRGLDKAELSETPSGSSSTEKTPISLTSEDFVPFDHSFSHTDLLLASAVLRDNTIPFFVDNPTSSDTIPIENEMEKCYTVHIHKTYIEKAHELLGEHFISANSKYLLKYTGARERLRAFNFHDLHLSEKEAAEELDVSFTADEKRIITTLGTRLLREAETVEKAQERILFYYDSIEPLTERLPEPDRSSLSRNDLLAILEILQIYADDPALPPSMDEAIVQLLSFFLKS